MKRKRTQPKCPVCGGKAHRTKDGWAGAPWRYVCVRGSCHFVGEIKRLPAASVGSRKGRRADAR